MTSSFSIWAAFCRVVLREVYFEGPNHVVGALKTSILNTGARSSLSQCECFCLLFYGSRLGG